MNIHDWLTGREKMTFHFFWYFNDIQDFNMLKECMNLYRHTSLRWSSVESVELSICNWLVDSNLLVGYNQYRNK